MPTVLLIPPHETAFSAEKYISYMLTGFIQKNKNLFVVPLKEQHAPAGTTAMTLSL